MKSLKPLWNLYLSWYYQWALSEIDPMHPDVGHLVTRLSSLQTHQ